MYCTGRHANIPQIGVSDPPMSESYKWWRLHGFLKRPVHLPPRHPGRPQPRVVSGKVFELVIAGPEAGLARARLRNGYEPEDA